ncbi:Hypothetical protein NCS54_00747300 [Fusarium falciforme]|uniref:Hypothetical protein n=1 Tax=Fusarium falciforme TaxID=195108 RepID=UPI002301F3C3|nr:Hypothetical protein NCS54_00747300 [Fusarium falciforme]WAO90065.1 Hypothetical protein NCS54_00747300 [Fusarium falciforme]
MPLIAALTRVVFIILVGNTAALAPPAATSTSGPRDTNPSLQRLEVRQAASDFAEVRSGTLTITVAPDATCGYDDLDDPALVCEGGRRCTWELAQHARVFCGWTSLRKTCLDSSAYFNTKLCDSKCRTNKLTYSCTSSAAPYCLRLRFGSGIIAYTCDSTIVSSDVEFRTTQSFEEREFSTVVLVDGKPVETISGPTDGPDSNPPIGAIVGGVVGGVGVIGLIVLGVFGLRVLGRRRSGNQTPPSPTSRTPVQEQTHLPNTKAASASSNHPELYG